MRNNTGYISFVHQFAEDVLVVCPSCSERAIVHTNGYSYLNKGGENLKVVCTSCGFSKVLARNPTVIVNGVPRKSTSGKHLIYGAPVDPFFHFPLWLQDKVRGNLLWAYNVKHLQFLREFVDARLRERNGKQNTNGSMGSRLPTWMTSKHNREVVIKTIDRLMMK